MIRTALLLTASVLMASACAGARAQPPHATAPHAHDAAIELEGATVRVRWSDGDSFRILEGARAGTNVRLLGFNTLESYGPVHRWGSWAPRELEAIAKRSKSLVEDLRPRCSTDGATDGYGRLLVRCPEAAAALVSAGHAFVFAVDEAPDAALLALQHEAQARAKGIWEKGVPPQLVTSVHSAEEGAGYDRVVDTRTGVTQKRVHDDTFELCAERCVGEGEAASCMRYVPYARRYRDRPDCLR